MDRIKKNTKDDSRRGICYANSRANEWGTLQERKPGGAGEIHISTGRSTIRQQTGGKIRVDIHMDSLRTATDTSTTRISGRPFTGHFSELLGIFAEQASSLLVEGVIGIGILHQGGDSQQDLADSQRWGPFLLQNVQADFPLLTDIGVENLLCFEVENMYTHSPMNTSRKKKRKCVYPKKTRIHAHAVTHAFQPDTLFVQKKHSKKHCKNCVGFPHAYPLSHTYSLTHTYIRTHTCTYTHI